MRPVCLDLFCGAGGCSKGYQEAGFYVVGVDINPQKRYIGNDFLQGDALEILRILIDGGCIVGKSGREYYLRELDLIAASPPCQGYSITSHLPNSRKNHPKLIESVRKLLKLAERPYIIENVPGAPLQNPLMLCGTMFGLRVFRHRLFECNPPVWFLPFSCNHWGKIVPSMWGDKLRAGIRAGDITHLDKFDFVTVVGNAYLKADGEIAMGIDWMNKDELSESIPPAYTKWLGQQLLPLIIEEKR